jgi:hypothetical protein
MEFASYRALVCMLTFSLYALHPVANPVVNSQETTSFDSL